MTAADWTAIGTCTAASSTNRWVYPITSVLFLTEGDGCGSTEHVALKIWSII